jgi:hypothetical protein
MSDNSLTDTFLEPPKKKIKYDEEIELYQFQIGYLTKKGYILLENKNLLGNGCELDYLDKDTENNIENDNYTILLDRHNRPFEMYILQFQSCEGADCYLVSNKYNLQIDINKGYTLKQLFDNFINGNYLIGTVQYYYKDHYKNGIIDTVSSYDDDINDEIRLHYTQLRSYEGNNAWRTINWDLFADLVPK